MAENNNSLLAGIISIHAPPRGATLTDGREAETPRFQFTPLREGRHAPERRGGTQLPDFNSRPSARGDPPRHGRRHADLISIHAPPRGATCNAAVRELATIYFNSRPSARGDKVTITKCAFPLISIHAPPRGATRAGTRCWRTPTFQFTPLREGRLLSPLPKGLLHNFNSRPSARGDAFSPGFARRLTAFQFTPLREGRPLSVATALRLLPISIHAPPRGATLAFIAPTRPHDISIHAPPRGATETVEASKSGILFQFTPLREGRRRATRSRNNRSTFQFTPLREGRRFW